MILFLFQQFILISKLDKCYAVDTCHVEPVYINLTSKTKQNKTVDTCRGLQCTTSKYSWGKCVFLYALELDRFLLSFNTHTCNSVSVKPDEVHVHVCNGINLA